MEDRKMNDVKKDDKKQLKRIYNDSMTSLEYFNRDSSQAENGDIVYINGAISNLKAIMKKIEEHGGKYAKDDRYSRIEELLDEDDEDEDENDNYEKEEFIDVLVYEPNKKPYLKKVRNELDDIKEVIGGGYIECLADGESVIVMDEEGKLKGLDFNRPYYSDYLCGTFFICGNEREDFTSIKKSEIERFEKMFGL